MAPSGEAPIASEIREISAADELGQSFLPYSLSVITARALPDVRDGLKPVQRRILVSMNRLLLRPANPHRKCATVVGDVIGKYHPHGDSAVYEALVRMGQPFSMRVPLIDPHGNFGSLDDPPAAYRYTECRLTEAAMELLGELDENTVEHRGTFDESNDEPEYLPARLPNLLVNGSTGIAVGMATNMAPHNLGEVVELLKVVLRQRRPKPTLEEMMALVPGPDFPTGGIIVDDGGLAEAYQSGRGTIRVRAKAEITSVTARRQGIVFTELPFAVGPERVITRIKELVVANKLDAITDVRNLSDRRHGLKLQIEVKTGADASAVLAELYRLTPLEDTFGINNVALVDGVPTTLGLYDLANLYLEHRLDVIVRRTQFRLDRALARSHVLEGLLVALDNIDRVIAIIRGSADTDTARQALIAEFSLSDIQATAILDMQLRRLTQLERQKLVDELEALRREIADYERILGSEQRRRTIVATELDELVAKLGQPRRSQIVDGNDAPKLTARDAPANFDLADDPCILTLSSSGLLGREADQAREKARARLGRHDVLVAELALSTHQTAWAVTDLGRALTVTAYEVPEVSGRGRGAAVSELFPVQRGESVLALLGQPRSPLVLVGASGVVKRLAPDEVAAARDGAALMALAPDDRLVAAFEAPEAADLVLVSSDAQALRMEAAAVPTQGRAARGVAGMKLRDGARVVAAGVAVLSGVVLTASSEGALKLTSVVELPSKGRNTYGVRLTRLKGRDERVEFATVADSDQIWCVLALPDEPDKPDPQPVPIPVPVTARDRASSQGARRLLAAGKARW
ncbi:MAG: DNA topoisomerase 4 subunit A [Acidimicrobiia bacterium]|nr:DNA topoisomerase 4 subunit A [Acidimicrobiia bacterium]